jgi:molybdate transport system ATP-binding protein
MTALPDRSQITESASLITLENIAVRVGKRFLLDGTFWEIKRHHNWAVLGPNGSGKSSLVGAIAGEVPVTKGKIVRHFKGTIDSVIGYVSFGLHQRIIAQEERRDDARMFSGDPDSFETVEESLLSGPGDRAVISGLLNRILDQLEMKHLLSRSIRFLSTGEMRKVIIAKAMLKSPRLLILDEPFDGLDPAAKDLMKNTIAGMTNGNTRIILVTHRFDEITPNISHVLCLKDGTVFLKGKREAVMAHPRIDRLYDGKQNGGINLAHDSHKTRFQENSTPETLIEMKNTSIGFGNIRVFSGLCWQMKQGENWAVIGSNGAGKSTFLRLITGDNLQAYANDIYLFGHRRGTGESVWDIKKRVGIVSSEFQIQYRKRITAYDVVLSGFFDSIGLYRHATAEQHTDAKTWIERLGATELAERRFDRLSDGEKRLVLLARAMVKSPTLLILDEPCQGLDPSNRGIILDLINQIGENLPTNLLYVTHHSNEIIPSISHILKLDKQAEDKAATVTVHCRADN